MSRGIKFIDLKKNEESLNFFRSISPNTEEQRKKVSYTFYIINSEIYIVYIFVTNISLKTQLAGRDV